MKRTITIIMVLILGVSSITFSLPPELRKMYLSHYRQNHNLKNKIKAIKVLSTAKDEIALNFFMNELCSTSLIQEGPRTFTGIPDWVRVKLVRAIRKYKNLPQKKLKAKFNALRKLIEYEPSEFLVGETLITAAIWVKKWDVKYKRIFAYSVNKLLKNVNRNNIKLIYKIIHALEIAGSRYSYNTLIKIKSMGYHNVITKRINQVLNAANY